MKRFLNNYFNPFIIFIYLIFLYSLHQLCRYGRGGLQTELFLFIACGILLIIWLIICLYMTYRQKDVFHIHYKHYLKIALCVICLSTVYEGLQIFRMATHLDNNLGFFLDDLKNKKTISLQNDNLYENGFLDFMDDFTQEFDAPKQLYLSHSFELTYDQEGKILSFEMFLYGKQNNEEKTYLISYKTDSDVTIYTNNHASTTYSENQSFTPLLEAMKVIPFEQLPEDFNKAAQKSDGDSFEAFHILYYGQRDWGYNDDGIIYIDSEGQQALYNDKGLIQGYTISVEPLNNTLVTPQRYIYVDDVNHRPIITQPLDDSITSQPEETVLEDDDTHIRAKVTQDIYYQLRVTDAAAGSRFYVLEKTMDQGKTWEIINEDPFDGNIGVTSGITFIDEKIGFIGMSSASQEANQLYYTHDGGKTFSPISIGDLGNYDYLSLPYQQDGNYYLKATQASMSEIKDDYQLYVSTDQGKTWQKSKK